MILKNIKKNVFLYISIIFYLFFAFYDGAIIGPDSHGYISMVVSREPLYPLFVNLVRAVFGENNYLLMIVILQSLLMAFSTNMIVIYFRDKYKLSKLLTSCVFLIMLSVSLLCRFISKGGFIYSNCIISESIAYPLFIIFFINLLEYIDTCNLKELLICSILSFLMISTRKQMYFSLALIILSILFVGIKKRNLIKQLLVTFVITICIFSGCKLFDFSYTKIVSNINGTHTSDNRFLTTMVFYTSNREYSEYIDDKYAKEIFIEIYDVCNENGYLKNSSSGNWFDRTCHFANNYDNIQCNNMWPMMLEYVNNKMNVHGNEAEVVVDSINKEISSSLLPHVLPELFSTILDNFISGFVITISASNYRFIYYSIIMYICYFVLLIYLLIKNGLDNYTKLGILTLISILINVSIVSVVIFNQTRYTIYNLALFYISGLLMLYKCVETFRYKKCNK